jgi:hypothetical protein
MKYRFNWLWWLPLLALTACVGVGTLRPLPLLPASIQTQPASLTVIEPAPATFTVVAAGSTPLTYQWRKNGVDLPGATSASLTLDPSRLSDAGTYNVRVDNAANQPVVSSGAVLTVTPAPAGPPQILQQPANVTVTAPTAATFRVVATGTLPLTYQWKKDGSTLAGATSSTLTLSPTSPADNGAYTVLVSNSLPPSVLSQAATLTVTAALSGTFAPTAGPMALGRAQHAATLLGDGKVLITGGNTAAGATATAELYDPATNRFTALPATLQAARYAHTATLLGNGKVLIAGGSGLFGPAPTAELYNPATGLFSRTADLVTARAQHTSTRLGDGRVLLTGGQGAFGSLASAEIYDPATEKFAATPAGMALGRSLHTATLLADGQVLLVGGQGSGGAIAPAERYNPATGGFSNFGTLLIPRADHGAARLGDGRVLVAGGTGSGGPLASAEWESAGVFQRTVNDLGSARTQASVSGLGDGRVLVAGGSTSTGALATAELFDPVVGRFTATGAMASARSQHTATVLTDGRVLVAGGTNLGGFLSSAERFQ